MPASWPAVLFGWPGPILATVLAVIGLVRARVAWLVAAGVVLLPFSYYLLLNPATGWGVALPVLPLIAAGAMSRGAKRTAWASVLVLVATLLSLAAFIFVGWTSW